MISPAFAFGHGCEANCPLPPDHLWLYTWAVIAIVLSAMWLISKRI